VHRVLPSTFGNSASSRRIQFHWDHVGDSGEVVTPFMQVGTYPTRNFATLGPSELRPPFTGPCIQSLSDSQKLKQFWKEDAPLLLSFQHRAGVRPYTSCYHLAESCVFSKQSPPPILWHIVGILDEKFFTFFSLCLLCPPFSEVTEVICRVPSTWFSLSLSFYNKSTCVGLSTVFVFWKFKNHFIVSWAQWCHIQGIRFLEGHSMSRD
jgi:hypothetical protein